MGWGEEPEGNRRPLPISELMCAAMEATMEAAFKLSAGAPSTLAPFATGGAWDTANFPENSLRQSVASIEEAVGDDIERLEALRDTLFYPMVSGRAEGSGLGLSIAQSILHQHQGLIECDSRPGHTEFRLLIPLVINCTGEAS